MSKKFLFDRGQMLLLFLRLSLRLQDRDQLVIAGLTAYADDTRLGRPVMRLLHEDVAWVEVLASQTHRVALEGILLEDEVTTLQ